MENIDTNAIKEKLASITTDEMEEKLAIAANAIHRVANAMALSKEEIERMNENLGKMAEMIKKTSE